MVVATTHLNADADALAALVALRRLYGPLEIVLPGGMEPTARRIWEALSPELPGLLPLPELLDRLERERADRLLVADTARSDRIGPLGERLARFRKVLAYDTHRDPGADLPRARMPEAASCAAALALRLGRRGVVPPAAEASLILLAIHVDTKRFSASETTDVDHRAAALCLRWGADPSLAARLLTSGLTAHRLELLQTISRSARSIATRYGPIALMTLERDRFEPDLSSLVGQLREAEGWCAAFLLASLEGRLYVMARSDGTIDAGAVLRRLGGGGHPSAASATLQAVTIRDAETMLREALKEQLGRGLTAGDLAVRRFASIDAGETIDAAAETLHRHGINALPLTEPGKSGSRFVGVVTRQEIDAALRHGLGARPVREIASRPPAWVPPDAPLAEARRTLLAGGRLLLVGEPPGDAIGVLTRTAVLQAGASPDESPLAAGARKNVLPRVQRALGRNWPAVERLGDLAAELGLWVHLVGGTVRDILLDRPVRDVDVVVEGEALRLARAARERFGGEVREHAAFGTATWRPEGAAPIDLATARAEYYESPGSLPQVLHAELRRDLYRRDFTINAMAIALDPGERGLLRDPFGGFEDLKRGLLRVLHGLSFHDDPTRAFRAARFAARFDFRLAPHTEGLLRGALRAGAFQRLSPSRLGRELDRLLGEREAGTALRLLREWHLLEIVHPALRRDRALAQRLTAAQNARHEMAGLLAGSGEKPPEQSEVLWLALAAGIPAGTRADRVAIVPRGRVRRRRWLTGPERVARALERIASSTDRAAAARALSSLDEVERVYALGIARNEKARELLRWWEREGRRIRTAVSGDDLLALGFAPGPALGRALDRAQRLAWNGAPASEQLSAARRELERAARRKEERR